VYASNAQCIKTSIKAAVLHAVLLVLLHHMVVVLHNFILHLSKQRRVAKVACIQAVWPSTRMRYLVRSWLLLMVAGSVEICKETVQLLIRGQLVCF